MNVFRVNVEWVNNYANVRILEGLESSFLLPTLAPLFLVRGLAESFALVRLHSKGVAQVDGLRHPFLACDWCEQPI
jgi:hypothetical protein